MNKTMKGMVAFALVSTMAGSALFAAPKSRPSKPRVEWEMKTRDAEYQTIAGKIRISKWGYVTLETDEGNRYVINVTDDPKLIGMNEVRAKSGSRVILSGKLNRDSKIFTVTTFGLHDKAGHVRDAK